MPFLAIKSCFLQLLIATLLAPRWLPVGCCEVVPVVLVAPIRWTYCAAPSLVLLMSGCSAGAVSTWLRKTGNNTSSRRVLIADAFPTLGLAHTLIATGAWLQIVTQTDRALSFAYCMPAAQQYRFTRRHNTMPACTDARVFDLHRHVSFAGLESLAADPDTLGALVARGGVHSDAPDCQALMGALRREEPRVLVLYDVPVSTLYECALAELPACLRWLQPRRPERPRTIPCDVGLHLRTLKLDDARCDLFSPHHPFHLNSEANDACPERWRWEQKRTLWEPSKPCTGEDGVDAITGCPGETRYATSDDPAVYARHTRVLRWRDLGETAVHTAWGSTCRGCRRPGVPDRTNDTLAVDFEEEASRTVGAWLSLARCTRAIVSPIVSAFSDLAARVAGIPIVRCCSRVHASSVTVFRQRARLLVDVANTSLIRQWQSGSHRGKCGPTVSDDPGDCESGDRGMWRLTTFDSSRPALAASACLHRCSRCRRCNFISVSHLNNDCSWFNTCNLSGLDWAEGRYSTSHRVARLNARLGRAGRSIRRRPVHVEL